ncbi:hypothetical protein RIF29_43324 [Crotalaria pallida]|uniref:Uncharacterized protein n=1 Tax=Crotalaria pallida TaxID=3830 RepID=A0AAN9HMR5_CROPI
MRVPALRDPQTFLDQSLVAVSQNLDALKDPLQIVRNLSEESGISTEGKVDSSSKLEEEINMTVGQVLSATKSQNLIYSKIQTFIQQSTKARESVAVCEKIENDLDSMEAEAENKSKGKDQIPRLQEQLAAVESDLTRDYDSLMTELEPLHAKLQSLIGRGKDALSFPIDIVRKLALESESGEASKAKAQPTKALVSDSRFSAGSSCILFWLGKRRKFHSSGITISISQCIRKGSPLSRAGLEPARLAVQKDHPDFNLRLIVTLLTRFPTRHGSMRYLSASLLAQKEAA